MKERFSVACGICGGAHIPDIHYRQQEGRLTPIDASVPRRKTDEWRHVFEFHESTRYSHKNLTTLFEAAKAQEEKWKQSLADAEEGGDDQKKTKHRSWIAGVRDQHRRRAEFFERALAKPDVERLSRWEAGLPEETALKFRNPFSLPAFAEVQMIPSVYLPDLQKEFGDYEIHNEEYIEAVAGHLREKIVALLAKMPQVKILEIGAGSGRLTYFLQNAVMPALSEENRARVQFKAVDSFENEFEAMFPIENVDYREAYEREQPQIVIASWPTVEWWKGPESVQEYILLGESEICAGGADYYSGELERNEEGDDPEWIQVDGFRQRLFKKATEVQTGKTGRSTTSIFERKE